MPDSPGLGITEVLSRSAICRIKNYGHIFHWKSDLEKDPCMDSKCQSLSFFFKMFYIIIGVKEHVLVTWITYMIKKIPNGNGDEHVSQPVAEEADLCYCFTSNTDGGCLSFRRNFGIAGT